MNKNKIYTKGFSNPSTLQEYEKKHEKYGYIQFQCEHCSFYGKINCDYGLCCYKKSKFYLETVFKHFGCEKHKFEAWGKDSCDKLINCRLTPEYLVSMIELCVLIMSDKRTILTKENKYIYLKIKDLLKD